MTLWIRLDDAACYNRGRTELMEFMEDASTHSVTFWLAAAKSGDPTAGQALFERYFARLISLSQTRVPRKLRMEDGEDAAVAAMYSFLQGIETGRFPHVDNRETLWPLLVSIVLANSRKQLRKQVAAKRREDLIRGDSVLTQDDDTAAEWATLAADQLDEQAIRELADSVQTIRRRLPELEREIFDLKLTEHSNREIAAKLDRPPRTIDRKVNGVILPHVLAVLQSGS
jgi:DNA-directed RNA polymerase specialized sigma24 family protein